MSHRHLATLIVMGAGILVAASPVAGQILPTTLVGTVTGVEGAPIVERDLDRLEAEMGLPLLAGDRIRTGDGRLAVSLVGAGRVYVDTATVVVLRSADIVTLERGRIEAAVAARPGRVDAPAHQVSFGRSGRYRIAVAADGTSTVAVLHGLVEVRNELGATRVDAGFHIETGVARAPTLATSFNTASLEREPFALWVASHVSAAADRYATHFIRPSLRSLGLRPPVAEPVRHPARGAGHGHGAIEQRWAPTWPYGVGGAAAIVCCEPAPRPEPPRLVERTIIIVSHETNPTPSPDTGADVDRPVYVSSGIRDPGSTRHPTGARIGGVRGATRIGALRGAVRGVTPTAPGAGVAEAPTGSVTTSGGTTDGRAPAGAVAATSPGRTGAADVRLPTRSTRYTRMSGRSARRTTVHSTRAGAARRSR